MRAEQFNRILAQVKGQRRREAGQRGGAALAVAGRICRRELRPLRPEPAPLRALHLADPPLRRSDRASRPDPRAQVRRRRPARTARTCAALAEIARADFRHRAARHEGRARDQRPADRAFPRRPHRRHVRGPHLRRHPRRPVRQARRHRRRRLHPGAHHRRRIFPLRRGACTPWSATAPARPIGSATASRSSWSRPRRLPARCASSFCPRAASRPPRSAGRPTVPAAVSDSQRNVPPRQAVPGKTPPMNNPPPEELTCRRFTTDARDRPSQPDAARRRDPDPARPQRARRRRC